MDRAYLELVGCVRSLIAAGTSRRLASLALLEAHPLCNDALRDAARKENFTRARSVLNAIRPSTVDRSALHVVDDAITQHTHAGRRIATPRARPKAARPPRARPVAAEEPQRPGPPPAFATGRKTVTDVEGPVEAIVPFHDRLNEVQRWISRPGDPLSLRPLPPLAHGSNETARWKQAVRDGAWQCPWPGCPQPRLILRVGEERVPHVAHVDARTHGTDADWAMATIAALQKMAGSQARTVRSNPLVVELGDTPFVLAAAAPWSVRLTRLIDRALEHDQRPPVVVIRATRLPKRVLPIHVHQEDRPRWGLGASDELVEGLSRARRVVAAPEPPNDDAPVDVTGQPVWGRDWLGLGLESTQRGWLDWRETRRDRRRPVVALVLGRTQASQVFATITGTHPPTPHRWWPSPGREHPGLVVGEPALLITCTDCGHVQLAKPMTDDAFDAITDGLGPDAGYAALEANTQGLCIYDRCANCRGSVDVRTAGR